MPGQGDLRLGLYVELPAGCTKVTPPRRSMVNSAYTERWTVKCPGGLSGGTIHIAGLSATVVDVLVRLERLDGSTQVTRLTPSAPSFVVAAPAGAIGVARTYTVLGVEHILSGVDHLLFVLALIIITSGGWKLVKTVTAFTVSHSITLTLATLGYVHVPQRPVEAVIALSIVFVASEILHARAGRPGLTARAPWVVALTFGLMHGLGFASGLSEAGLPDGHIPTALLFFSLGVEAGHFLFIGVVLSLVALARRVRAARNRNGHSSSRRTPSAAWRCSGSFSGSPPSECMKPFVQNVRTAWKVPRWRTALIIALVSDALGFAVVLLPVAQWLLDAATAAALLVALGFRWQLFTALAVEVIPAVQLFPAWTLVVLTMAATTTQSAPHGARLDTTDRRSQSIDGGA